VAIALLVLVQRVLEVLPILPAELGHAIDLGERRAVLRNAVATDAHRNLALARLCIADDIGRLRAHRKPRERDERCGHDVFADERVHRF
jgi:hypothetical protein